MSQDKLVGSVSVQFIVIGGYLLFLTNVNSNKQLYNFIVILILHNQ